MRPIAIFRLEYPLLLTVHFFAVQRHVCVVPGPCDGRIRIRRAASTSYRMIRTRHQRTSSQWLCRVSTSLFADYLGGLVEATNKVKDYHQASPASDGYHHLIKYRYQLILANMDRYGPSIFDIYFRNTHWSIIPSTRNLPSTTFFALYSLLQDHSRLLGQHGHMAFAASP